MMTDEVAGQDDAMTAVTTVAAVDLGASSGRVVAGRLTGDGAGAQAELHEVHRFPNVPVRAGASLRWDVLALFRGVTEGLHLATRQFGPLDGVGADSWAVDFGCLDADGELIGNPVSYRDAGTDTAVRDVLTDLGADGLYAATGIQLQPFNTVFQLLARRSSAAAGMTRQVLLIPDLISYWLSGQTGTELTNASTTGLIDPRTRDWSHQLATRLGLDLALFGPLRSPGTVLGPIRRELGLAGDPAVIIVPSHDTAAAVAGIPADTADFAYVSTGTWALVGVELPAPVISEASRAANFTNELGAGGTVRFLRNVTGFWLLQECVRHWQRAGQTADVAKLTAAAGAVPGLRALVDVQDPAFIAPSDMPALIRSAARGSGGPGGAVPLDTQAEVTRCILDSMCLAIRDAVRDAAALSGRPVRVVHVVGGGVASPVFCQLVADACQLPVIAGPAEAASWGNVMSQFSALGVIGSSLPEQRALIRRSIRPVSYLPRGSGREWDEAASVLRSSAPARTGEVIG